LAVNKLEGSTDFIGDDDDGIITVSVMEACRRSGLSRSYLYQEIAAHRIPSITKGKRRLILLSGLKDYLSRSS